MLGFFCLHTPLSHEESPGFQDSPTLIGNAFRHWKLGSRLLRTSKSDPLPSNRLATLQITFSWFHFFITKNLIPALDSFKVISCTVECTLGEQIVFRLKTRSWTIQNWGPCSCAQAMTLPAPLPSKCTEGTSWNDWTLYSNSFSILQIKNFKCKWVHES
jgi:hypothetical protein